MGGRKLVHVRIVIAAIFDFMTVEIVTRRFREQKHLRAQSTAGYPGTLGWKPFDDVTGVECDVLGQQVPRQTLDDHSTVINFLE